MPIQWKSTSESFVAFLDVLGFRSLVRNNTHTDLERIYSRALLNGLSLGLSNGRYIVVENGGQDYLTNDLSSIPVNSLVVFDSIIIWTEDATENSFRTIVSVVRGILAHSCFNGLPLRGAIEIGPVTWMQRNHETPTYNVQQTVIGNALCKAHDLEKDQEWSGCVIGNEAIQRITSTLNASTEVYPSTNSRIVQMGLCLYDVPFKSGTKSMYVIDWVNHPEVTARSETVANAFVEHNKMQNIPSLAQCPRIKAKLDNTLRFVRHVFPEADRTGLAAVWAAVNR